MSTESTARSAEIITSPVVAVAQRHQVLLVNLPSLAAVAVVIPWSMFQPPTKADLVFAVILAYATMGIGVSVCFHRLLTHRSFKTYPAIRYAMAVLGSMAGQGPVTAWVSIHRRHHSFSDHPGDPHSPHVRHGAPTGGLRGLWHSHFGWFMNYDMPNPLFYAKDILRDRGLMFISRSYFVWVALGVLLPGCVSFVMNGAVFAFITGVLWGGFLRLFVTSQLTSSINSLCHLAGARAFNTTDKSVNNAALGILVFGEGWHNNHHRFPSSAALGLKPSEVDFGYCFIVALRVLRLAWNVKCAGENLGENHVSID